MNLKDLNKFNSDFLDGKHASNSANNVPVLDKNAKLLFDQIPTGVTKTTVAVGEHIHDDLYHTKEEMNDIILANNDVVKSNVLNDVSKDYTTKTEFNDLKIGGRNLLLNTMFEGAKPGTKTCPNWIFSTGSRVYIGQGQENYNDKNTLYIEPTKDATATSIEQKMNPSPIPKNTTITLSGVIEAESNVLGYRIWLKFYNSAGTKIREIKLRDDNGYGYFEHTLTTPDIDYTSMKLEIEHKGATSLSAGAFLLMVKNLMLEIGTKASNWQPAPGDMASKSMVTQTTDKIKSAFQQGGGFPNLIANGSPTQTNDNTWGYWNATKYTGDNNYTELGFYSNKPSENNCCLYSSWMVVSPGKTYSISFWAYCEPNVVNPYVVAKCGDSNYENLQYPSLCELKLGNANDKKWYKYKINWTAPSGITRMQLCFHQRNHTVDVNYVTRIDQVMVIEGRDIFPNKWYPKFQEIQSNSITANLNEITLRHSNGAKAIFDKNGCNFYGTSGKRLSGFTDGQYYAYYGDRYIGFVGNTNFSNGDRVLTMSSRDYNTPVTLAVPEQEGGQSYSYVHLFGHDTTIGNILYRRGLTLYAVNTSNMIRFWTPSNNFKDNYPSWIGANDNGQLILAGDNNVALGILYGSEFKSSINIEEITESPNKKIHFYGRIDMHGWEIYNTNIINNVSATSAQTYALRSMSDEETYSDPTAKAITDIFPSQTPTEGEIRWTDRETYFTSEVETGVYECYIEMPWWIAQNLENNYHVTITPTNGFYQYYVSERDPYYFIVRSDKDGMGFTFEINGKLLDNNTTANNTSIAGDQYINPVEQPVENSAPVSPSSEEISN